MSFSTWLSEHLSRGSGKLQTFNLSRPRLKVLSWFSSSARLRLVRTTVRSEPRLCVVILIWTLVVGVVPILVLISMSHVIADVPKAELFGLSSSSGHRLIGALVTFGFLFALSLAEGPSETALKMYTKSRVTFHLQERLMDAVNAPIGIEHLENSDVLDQLALAQGRLMNFFPGDAPMTLASATSTQIQGVFACTELGLFRWWMGLGVAAMWIVAHIEMHKEGKAGARLYSGNANPLRRAFYFNDVATKPTAAKELRVFGLGAWVVSHLREHWEIGMTQAFANQRKFKTTYLKIGVIAAAVFSGCCIYLAHAAREHQIGLGTVTLILVMLVASQRMAGITIDSYQLHWMLSGFPQLEDVEQAVEAKLRDHAGIRSSVSVPKDEIQFQSVSFRYPGSQSNVFEDLNFTLPRGKSTAIVGANGAGKTTLVKLLSRLHDPTSGRILVDGTDLLEFEPREWQRRIAVVFQDFSHYPLSARENVAFGAVEYLNDQEGIEVAADKAALQSIVDELPNGWDTILSREFNGGTDLSGGQWQRFALARALFAARHGAGVLVLDEPTAWLDVRGEAAFYEQFLDITHGLTTIVISHRFSTVRLADQIVVIEGGRVSERGNHDELVQLGGTYASMFALQAARFSDDELMA